MDTPIVRLKQRVRTEQVTWEKYRANYNYLSYTKIIHNVIILQYSPLQIRPASKVQEWITEL